MADEDLPDTELDPSADSPESSRAWLALITHAEKEFRTYQDKCDNIDKAYASLEKLASTTRDRQFQMFWANIQVLAPSIYSRPPIPVVTPRFRDRKPIPRSASELLERATIVGFELESIDQIMRQVRDDMAITARGAVWIRYEAADKGKDIAERVCIEHADRKDFLHDPARTWKVVDWVAKRSWGTKKEWRKRFYKTSKNAYKDLAYEKRKDETDGADDGTLKAGVWEIWSKSLNKVVWVGEGADKCLDSGEPHLDLEGFFPTPKPAYGTVQRRSLVPVPDMVFYKDQLEEINELTARISALTDAVKLRGFYPAGAGEIGDAIDAAVKNQADNVVLIPISNWSLLGSGAAKDTIVWLPLTEVVTAIQGLVELRKQLIDDVYQITGLSDIMRGATDARETLGAQELKSQYGSIRVKDRQDELIRFARDITRISAEIMAENFQDKTLLSMSQLEIPTKADLVAKAKPLQQQIAQITAQIQKAQTDPATMQAAQQNPEHAKEILGKAQQQIQGLNGQLQKLEQTVTIEQVMDLLRSERIRPFVLDIETDSTIAPDENAQKQRATEFITAVGGFMGQAFPLVEAMPEAAPIAADMLKFVAGQFRVGREMQGKIEEFADQMATKAGQQKGPSPEQQKAQADIEAKKADAQMKAQAHEQAQQVQQADAQRKDAESAANQEREERKLAATMEEKDRDEARKQQIADLTMRQMDQKHAQEMDKGVLEIELKRIELEKLRTPEPEEVAEPEKGPSESISFKDLPPDGQAQMAAQAGIHLTPQTLQQHADDQQQKQADLKAAAKPKAMEPA
jgi:hypothetical protein